MFRSLRSRLLFTHLLVSGLVLLIVGVGLVLILLNSRLLDRQLLARMEGVAELTAERGGRAVQLIAPERLNQILGRIGVREARLLVIGPGQEILADSRPAQDPPPSDLLTVPANDEGVVSGSFGGLLSRSLYVSQPLGEDRALLMIAPRPTALAALAEETLLPIVLRAGLVALLASIVLAWLISRWVAAPLRRTAEAARAVAAGDLNQQLAPAGPEEAHSLATSFNEMVQQVRSGQQAMRDFVANVSHELKTPLTSIQGFAQAILDGTAADPQHAGGVIHDEAARLARLVEELLDLAKLDTGQAGLDRRPVDLPAILSAIVERLGLKAQQRGIMLENRANSLPVLIGDGDRLAQVFTNLIDNALKHTPRGGVVKLGSELEPAWITIHVDDGGPGIPPSELSRIFERFYQLDKARSGSGPRGVGLGLAISREIVQAHGGTITAASSVGQGSRFSVRLPITRPQDETLARSRAEKPRK